MSNKNVLFNGDNYTIDASILSSVTSAISSHLATMNGTGATVKFNGTNYNIDKNRLDALTTEFVSHLGTLSSGSDKLTIDGISYSVGGLDGAKTALRNVLSGAVSGGDETDIELNEYGFVYGEEYGMESTSLVFYENGTCEMYQENQLFLSGTAIYSVDNIVVSMEYDGSTMTMPFTVTNDGEAIYNEEVGYYLLGGTVVVDGDYTYHLNTENEVWYWYVRVVDTTKSSYGGIKSEINGKPIVDISFYGCTNLTVFPTIPESVTSIGDRVFQGCSSLTNVMIPNNITDIGNSAFSDCSSLMSITIPASVESIGEWAFNGCSNLTSIEIPEGVTSIGEYAFQYCESLASVTIPASVTSIGDRVFNLCTSLTHVDYAGTIAQWDAINKENYDYLNYNNSITYIQCSDGQVSLSGGSDSDALPAGLYDANGVMLTSWEDLIANGTVLVNDGVVSKGDDSAALSGTLILPNDGSVTSIGDSAFFLCTSLTGITIPDSVTNIGNSAFSSCAITSIEIPDSVIKSIKKNTFASCTKLTNVTIGNGVTSIGEDAFSSCTSLASITIGNGVTSINRRAFNGCSKLIDITFGANSQITSIGEYAFQNCSSLASITIPESVTSINTSAFVYCSKLANITFGGTMAQWDAITKGQWWNYDVPATYVQCSDGTVTL